MPDLLAVEVKAIDARFAEEDVELLPIRDRRARRISLIGAFAGVVVLGQDRLELLGPEDRAIRPVEADDMAAQVFLLARVLRVQAIAGIAGDEDALAEDDRR
ncbi:MAG: hypothetical protein U0793_33335 [Gemmataceae bacterium]